MTTPGSGSKMPRDLEIGDQPECSLLQNHSQKIALKTNVVGFEGKPNRNTHLVSPLTHLPEPLMLFAKTILVANRKFGYLLGQSTIGEFKAPLLSTPPNFCLVLRRE